MTDHIETAVEATSEMSVSAVTSAAAIAVLSLATYGGVDLTRKVVGKAKTLIADRKAKKAVENVVPSRSEA